MEDIQTPPAADPMAPVVDTPPVAPDAPSEVVDETPEPVADRTHTIEHRSFGRASADEPMPVTTHTGN